MRLKKLLAPTDLGEYSQFALKYAAAFAEAFAPKLYVLHVHEPYPQGAVFEGMVYDSQLVAKAEAKARRGSGRSCCPANSPKDPS